MNAILNILKTQNKRKSHDMDPEEARQTALTKALELGGETAMAALSVVITNIRKKEKKNKKRAKINKDTEQKCHSIFRDNTAAEEIIQLLTIRKLKKKNKKQKSKPNKKESKKKSKHSDNDSDSDSDSDSSDSDSDHENEAKRKTNSICYHCHKKGHFAADCWVKHPNLRPQHQKQQQQQQQTPPVQPFNPYTQPQPYWPQYTPAVPSIHTYQPPQYQPVPFQPAESEQLRGPTPNSTSRPTNRPYCTHCQKHGHYLHNCWFVSSSSSSSSAPHSVPSSTRS
jgi:hypothetical protein